MSTTNGTKEPIRIASIEVSNFMRLRAAHVELDPGAGLVRVTGKNRAGKTSLLRSISAALAGAGVIVQDPIHDGAEDASFTKLTLTNGFSIERRFTPATPKGYLSVVGPDGGKYGQQKLDEWAGPYSFAPLAFLQLKAKERRQVFLDLSSDPALDEKLEAIEARRAELYEGRTEYIRQRRQAGDVPEPEGERPEPVDVSAEMARLEALQRQQREVEDAEAYFIRAEQKIADYEDGIRKLEARLAEARRMLAEEQANLAAERERRGQITDPTPEIDAIRARLADANHVNAALDAWKRWDEAQAAYAEAQERERELTALLGEIDAEKDALLAEAGPPIPGLTFGDEGEPLLNGRAFEEWSGAEKIQVAVAVALHASPDLRVCLVDEANDLDTESLAELDRLAKEHEFMVFACRVDTDRGGEIIVEDGVAAAGGVA